MHLEFAGTVPLAPTLFAACGLGTAAWFLYRHELRNRWRGVVKVLPWLRASAIAMLTLMLAGPTLHRRLTQGAGAPLVLLIDGSQSMAFEDFRAGSRLPEPPRYARLAAHLLHGESASLLSKLHRAFDLRILISEGRTVRTLWTSAEGLSRAPTLLPEPTAPSTNLHEALRSLIHAPGDATTGVQPAAVVLLSDGQHNEGASPAELGRAFAGSGVPLFTVGVGSPTPPPDLALRRVEAPRKAAPSDQIQGRVWIGDSMPANSAFDVIISHLGREVWHQSVQTGGGGEKSVPFQFPLKPVLDARGAAVDASHASAQLGQLEFDVAIPALEEEARKNNNTSSFKVRLSASKRRMLILDGRPRWETRYLESLFERNPLWEVNVLLQSAAAGSSAVPRGSSRGTFPASQEILNQYDIILLGEWDRSSFRAEELQWISDFVAQRGGSLVLLDGPRGALRDYEQGALASALPVTFPHENPRLSSAALLQSKLTPTGRAARLPAFTLSARSVSAEQPFDPVWHALTPPTWIASCRALPGAEVLMEAHAGNDRLPMLVFRFFGAGRVLYCASDQTWRWRFEVGGIYQERFWNQLIDWTFEEPFAAINSEAALDAGDSVQPEGSQVTLRAKTFFRRSPDSPAPSKLQAQVLREGVPFSTLHLMPDSSRIDTYEARTEALPAGHYTVRLAGESVPPAASQLSAEFEVERPPNAELLSDGLHEELLKKLASDSGGAYLPEGRLSELPEALAPFQRANILDTRTPLWSGYPWFVVVMTLLAVEWGLRKKSGLI